MTSQSAFRPSRKKADATRRGAPAATRPLANERLSELLAFLDASPTPHHVVHNAARKLVAHGFHWFDSLHSLPNFTAPMRGVITRDGALVAFAWNPRTAPDGLRMVGAHTDSPGLHLKSRRATSHGGLATVGVEVYGSPLLNSWLDRDLEVAGTAVLADGTVRPWRSPGPVARLSQLAVHLDRQVNDSGVVLDRHAHLRPLWSDGPVVSDVIARWCNVSPGSVVDWDARFVDAQPAAIIGDNAPLLASGRLDNLVSCWGAIRGIADYADNGCAVVALFDHEEVGSNSATGAAGPMLGDVVETLFARSGHDRSAFIGAMQASLMLSADNSHGIHPNYPERHDPEHAPVLHSGVAVKRNVGQRYATTARSAAAFVAACDAAGARHQSFASRNNVACGSTIGPIAATRLGIDTVDAGVPQLSMHSAREVCSVADALDLALIVRAFLAPARRRTPRRQSAVRASRRA